MSSSNSTGPPKKLKNGRFDVEKKLGAGCFGEVWLGKDNELGQQVAVKFEDAGCRGPQLEHECSVLDALAKPTRPQGVAQLFHQGQEGRYHCMVMELLGKSLEDRMKQCGNFSITSAVLVADQLLNRIEYLHSKCIVHRDIKPENFMFGVKNRIHHLYIIDFGLSKRYYTTQHAQFRTKLSLTGTARYASINAHRGFEQSRRDDLEAIGHMLFYFIRGSLPWSGLAAKTQEEKYRKICEKKEEVPLDTLCQGFPDAFKVYLKTARGLEFKERPDYNALRKLFREVRKSLGDNIDDHSFQWFEGKDLGQIEALAGNGEGLRQPDDKAAPKRSKGMPCLCGGKSNVKDD